MHPVSAHTLVVAAIFTAYVLLMGGLVAYIAWTGRPRSDDPPDGDVRQAALSIA